MLQDRTFEAVGSSKSVRVDVRVVAATNQNLTEAIAAKRFREDLFYRLNVIPVEAPPLRERQDDIPLLLQHFLDASNQQQGKQVEGFSDEALQLLCGYHWPGNVRELENLVERLVILNGTGEIGVDQLPEGIGEAREPALKTPEVTQQGLSFKDVVDRFETDLILQALEHTQWNKNRAAQLLRLNRTTLLEKMKKKGLEHTRH